MAPDQELRSGEIAKPIDVCNNAGSIEDVPLDVLSGCSMKDTDRGDAPEVDVCNDVNLEWFQVQRVGAGLANLGNTCFLNTVIQCLTYCPPLANYLLQYDHCSTCQSFEFCMMCELQKHVRDALEHSGDVIEPTQIYENIKLIAEHFQSGQQEDAHEFLRFVIENLRRVTQYSSSECLESAIHATTVVNYIFGGYNRSQVVCLRCKKMSNTYEHCMDLILDIKHNANTLEKALEQYVKPEILEKDNAYNCPACKALVSARKTYTIHRAPNVATIQLKRFDYNKSHGGKITKHVSYPEELDLRPFMSDKTEVPILYKLNAVLVHVGQNCTSGHYYCYIRNSNGGWYLMDDARVQRVPLSDVLNEQAYLLFYVRAPVTKPKEDIKKNGLSVPEGSRLLKSNKENSMNGYNKQLYAPVSKWMSRKTNHWPKHRKFAFTMHHGKRGDSRGSSSSVDSEKSSCGSSENNCFSMGRIEDNRNGFTPWKGSWNKTFFPRPVSFHGKYHHKNDRYVNDSRMKYNGYSSQQTGYFNGCNRSNSDSNICVKNNRDFYQRNFKGHSNLNQWYSGQNDLKSASYNNKRYFAGSYNSGNKWENRNYGSNHHSYYNGITNKHNHMKERNTYRYYNESPKNVNFSSFPPHRRFNPYFNPRRHPQACF